MATDLSRRLHAVPDATPDPTMSGRARLEQAKGMLMLYYGVPQQEAFSILIRWSTLWDVAPSDVASTLLDVGMETPLVTDTPDLVRAMGRAFAHRQLDDEARLPANAPLRSV